MKIIDIKINEAKSNIDKQIFNLTVAAEIDGHRFVIKDCIFTVTDERIRVTISGAMPQGAEKVYKQYLEYFHNQNSLAELKNRMLDTVKKYVEKETMLDVITAIVQQLSDDEVTAVAVVKNSTEESDDEVTAVAVVKNSTEETLEINGISDVSIKNASSSEIESFLKKDIDNMNPNELLSYTRDLLALFTEPKAVRIDPALKENMEKIKKSCLDYSFDKLSPKQVKLAKTIIKVNIFNIMEYLGFDTSNN